MVAMGDEWVDEYNPVMEIKLEISWRSQKSLVTQLV